MPSCGDAGCDVDDLEHFTGVQSAVLVYISLNQAIKCKRQTLPVISGVTRQDICTLLAETGFGEGTVSFEGGPLGCSFESKGGS